MASNYGGDRVSAHGGSAYGSSAHGNASLRRQAEAIRRRSGDRRRSGVSGRGYRGPERRLTADAVAVLPSPTAASDPAMPKPQNVMELLVEEEIELQLMNLSVQQRMEIQIPQVMAYALNRLPSLYVTSERGWRRQWIQGKSAHPQDIAQAVRQAIVAVQRDPLRIMGPLSDHLPEAAEVPMAQLRKMLQEPHLSWSTLVPTIQKLLVEGKLDFPDEVAARQAQQAKRTQAVDTAGVSATETDRESFRPTEADGFDWDSHPLHQRGY